MIEIVKGNIFKSLAGALVNPVNCVGVSGAGLARQFKMEFPTAQYIYEQACRQRVMKPGVLVYAEDHGKTIIYFPTKRHWRDPSLTSDIELGLDSLRKVLEDRFVSVAMPALGCGLGGLQWDSVRLLIEQKLGDLDIDIEVYEPVED